VVNVDTLIVCDITIFLLVFNPRSVCLFRSDTVRYALDILAILTVVPKVQLVLADTVDVLDENRSPVSTVGQ